MSLLFSNNSKKGNVKRAPIFFWEMVSQMTYDTMQKSRGVMLIIVEVCVSFFHIVFSSGCNQISSEMLYEWKTMACALKSCRSYGLHHCKREGGNVNTPSWLLSVTHKVEVELQPRPDLGLCLYKNIRKRANKSKKKPKQTKPKPPQLPPKNPI